MDDQVRVKLGKAVLAAREAAEDGPIAGAGASAWVQVREAIARRMGLPPVDGDVGLPCSRNRARPAA